MLEAYHIHTHFDTCLNEWSSGTNNPGVVHIYWGLFPHGTHCTDTNTRTRTKLIRSWSHRTLHTHKSSIHKTTIFVVLDGYCIFCRQNLSLSPHTLTPMLTHFEFSGLIFTVIIICWKCDLDGITSIQRVWHTYWVLPSSFYNPLHGGKNYMYTARMLWKYLSHCTKEK